MKTLLCLLILMPTLIFATHETVICNTADSVKTNYSLDNQKITAYTCQASNSLTEMPKNHSINEFGPLRTWTLNFKCSNKNLYLDYVDFGKLPKGLKKFFTKNFYSNAKHSQADYTFINFSTHKKQLVIKDVICTNQLPHPPEPLT